MLRYTRVAAQAAAFCAASCLVACSTGDREIGQGALVPKELPRISTLDSRSTSATADVTRNGIETLAQSASCIAFGQALYIASQANVAEWAVYQLTPPAGMTVESVDVDISGDEGWIGVADYGKSNWQLTGPFGSEQSIDLSAGSYMSPGGHVYIAVVVTGAHGVTVTNITLHASGNLPPSASFTATPQTGQPGDPTTLDASGSSDSDGTIVKYEWDLDGDGIFELDNGLVPTAPTDLPDPAGTVQVGLQVTDDGGAAASTTLTLTGTDGTPVAPVWVQQPDLRAYNPVIAIINGNPAVVYDYLLTDTERTVRYRRATDSNGSAWGAPVDIASNLNVGYPRLKTINGKPAVVYVVSLGSLLMYAQAQDADGATWNAPVQVCNDCYSEWVPLAEVNGSPAVIVGRGDLFYIRATDPDGTAWGPPISIGPSLTQGTPMDIAEVNGRPAAAYLQYVTDSWKYRFQRANDADGADWGSTSTVMSSSPTGPFPQTNMLCFSAGNPAMLCYDNVAGNFFFVRADNIDGSAWGTPTLMYSAGSSFEPQLASIGGIPSIVTGNGGDRLFISAQNPEGTSWDSAITFDTIPSGNQLSLVDVGGAPGIAYEYREASPSINRGIKYTKLW